LPDCTADLIAERPLSSASKYRFSVQRKLICTIRAPVRERAISRRPKADKPSEEYANFEKLAKQLISVPKSEIDKREAEYQRAKKVGKKRQTA